MRRALGSVVQTMPLSYAWNGVPDVKYGWWWTPGEDQPWSMPSPPRWAIRMKAVHDVENGDFYTDYMRIDDDDETVMTDGPIVHIRKSWRVLRNRNGTGFLGVTIWTTLRADGVTFVTFRFVNGIHGKSQPFRFERLAIEFDGPDDMHVMVRGLRANEHIGRGDGSGWIYRIVPDDEPQFWPVRGVLVREVAIVRDEHLIRRVHGDWHGEYLTLPSEYSAFGPSKSTLPNRGSDRNLWGGELGALNAAKMVGIPISGGPSGYVQLSAPFGPWQPAGHNLAYTHGGDGIDMGLGWERDATAAMVHVEMQRHIMERMMIACVDERTGDVLTDDRIAPFAYHHSRGADEASQIPAFRKPLWNPTATAAPYEHMFDQQRDDAWHPFDSAHLIRAMRHAINAWWIAGDFSAREDLIQIGEDAGMGDWSAIGVIPFTPAYDGQYIVPSLRSKLVATRKNPGRGGWLERGFGWTLTARAALYCLTPPGPNREVQRAWISEAQKLAVDASHPHCSWTQNASWTWTSPMPENETGIQSFEWGIVVHGLACVAFSCHRVGSRGYKQIEQMIHGGSVALYHQIRPVPGTGGTVGPPKYVACYRAGEPLTPSQCVGYGLNGETEIADVTHVYHAIAMTARVTRLPYMLDIAIGQWIPLSSLEQIHDWITRFEDPRYRPWVSEMESVFQAFD